MDMFDKKRLFFLMVLFWSLLCFFSCTTSKDTSKNDIGLKLKKEAVEEKAAFKQMQYQQRKKANPNYLALAQTLTAKGFYDIALKQLKTAEKKDAENPEIFYLQGVCFCGKKDFENAVIQFEKAISINPGYSYAFAGLGITYSSRGEHSKAVTFYTKAIQLDPGVSSFHNNLGVSLMADGKLKKAVESFQKGVALNPNFSRAANNLGLAYGMLGEFTKAFEIFKKTGNEAAAYNNLGYVCQLRGETKMALQMYHKAIEADPDFSAAKQNLNQLEQKAKTTDK